jgi:hypothetical protein
LGRARSEDRLRIEEEDRRGERKRWKINILMEYK